MKRRDYRIIISADVNDTTYWQLLRERRASSVQ